MDNRYNIKIHDLKVRDRLIEYQKSKGLRSQQDAIKSLLDNEETKTK